MEEEGKGVDSRRGKMVGRKRVDYGGRKRWRRRNEGGRKEVDSRGKNDREGKGGD